MLLSLPNIGQDNVNLSFTYDDELEMLNNNYGIVYHDSTLPHFPCEITKMANTYISPKIEANIGTLSIIKNQEFMDRWVKLYRLFEDVYKRNTSSFGNISFERIEKDFKYSLDSILKYSPNIVSVGSDEDCIFIYAEFENKAMFFNLFFEDDKTEVLLNLTEDREPIGSFNSDVEKSLLRLRSYVEEKAYENTYDLSSTFITETRI